MSENRNANENSRKLLIMNIGCKNIHRLDLSECDQYYYEPFYDEGYDDRNKRVLKYKELFLNKSYLLSNDKVSHLKKTFYLPENF